MPSKNKQYNLVQSDDLDSRIPLMPEEAFQHGIPFNCKFIGSMDIPRPTSRVEIVAAMRRVRVEFKAKGVKKKKVTLTISIDGMKTTLRKKNRKRKKRNNSSAYVDVDGGNSMVVLSHPIYRIFYVSHDSQDVKIFSYIARETSSNVFHCCVFKAANKNQAMRIVRTVGQAFEVCHKLVGVAGEEDESEEVHESETNLSSQMESKGTDVVGASSATGKKSDHLILPPQQQSQLTEALTASNNNNTGSNTSLLGGGAGELKGASSSTSNTSTPPAQILASALTPLHHHNPGSLECVPEATTTKGNNKPRNLDLNKRDFISSNDLMNLTTPTSSTVPTPTQSHSFFKEIGNSQQKGKGDKENNLAQVHEAQLLKEQLEQQTQNTRAALAQIQLLRDQLAAESAARIEAQARTHQLLIHNKELLDHLQTLVRHIQELEGGGGKDNRNPGSNNSIAAATGVTLPQLTPRSKIERWFSFVVPPSPKLKMKKKMVGVNMKGEEDVGDLIHIEEDDDDNDEEDNMDMDDYGSLLAADFESLDKAIKHLRLSRRTLLSNKESGFVSETDNSNTRKNKKSSSSNSKKNKAGSSSQKKQIQIQGKGSRHRNPHHQHHLHQQQGASSSGLRHRNGTRLSSTSSWLGRVLRLKSRSSLSSDQYSRKKLKERDQQHQMDYWNNDAQSTSTTHQQKSKQQKDFHASHSPGPTTINNSLTRVNSSKSRVSSL